MAAKIDSSSPVEPRGQSAVSSAASTSSPKISMLGAKSGFVIPKNRLSGSLVPIFRGGSKVDAGSTVKEESSKEVQRKTKWGADLTQDSVVRKGRTLAYQTRVEQITQELKSGALEIGDDQSSWSPKHSQQSTPDHVDQKGLPPILSGSRNSENLQARKLDLLEFEKRELIGEILRLNPSYKAPPDYKPLLKECKVPIPVKAYPGYNFIGLLLGPESNAQKRLEEETGAKIRVYGTKESTKEKREITQSDISEAQDAYEELYVNVSADAYEKVDAAVSLIELLVTPVAGNASVASKNSTSVAGDNVMTTVADANKVVPQSMLVSAPSDLLQYQQQYSGPWFPIAPPNAPPRPASGFMPLQMANYPVQFPPYFQSGRPQLPLQAMQQPPRNQFILPQNQAMSGQQPPPTYPGQQPPPTYPFMVIRPTSNSASFTASRPMLSGPIAPTRPSASMNQQPVPVNSSGWSSAPIVPLPQGPNMAQMAPQPFNRPVRPQQVPNNVIRPPSVNLSPATFPSQPTVQASFTPVPPQTGPVSVPAAVPFTGAPLQAPIPPTSLQSTLPFAAPRPSLPAVSAVPQPPLSQPLPSLIGPAAIVAQARAPSQSAMQVMTQPPVPFPSVSPGLAQPLLQAPQPPSSSSGSIGNPPPVPGPKPIRPRAGDFTFQPLKAQVPESPTTPRPSTPSLAQNISAVPLAAPQAPSFRPASQTLTPTVGTPNVLLPSAANQQRPTQPPMLPTPFAAKSTQSLILPTPTPTSFPITSTPLPPSPRFLFPNTNTAPHISPITQMGSSISMALPTQMGPPSFSPALRAPTLANAMPAHPPNFLQLHQNQPPPANRPSGFMIPNQLVGSNQIYDPFSPTSISSASHRGGEQQVRKQETDAEYEDLMASVGVK